MKTYIRTITALAASACVFMALGSCTKNDNQGYYYLYPNALVTVKPLDNGDAFYMQLDDKTTIEAENLTASPFGDKEVRALASLQLTDNKSEKYDKTVIVHRIDSIRTKSTAADLGAENDQEYGHDPVEIVNDWVTIVEDGYFTLRFRTRWSTSDIVHEVNLLTGTDPDDPYTVEFRHNAHGDTYGEWGDGIVAFRLDQLPDTNGETVDLTLKWQSFSGEKSAKFKYCTKKTTPGGGIDPDAKYSIKLQ